MSTIESPLAKAHRHAANADEWLSKGLWVIAAEEHQKAANAFLACIDSSTEDNTKRTLRLLNEEHQKHAKDLQRKITQLCEEGKDPTLPQQRSLSSHKKNLVKQDLSQSNSSTARDAGVSIDESFMILGNQKNELSSSFAQFWKLLEGMLDQLSQPVAFATASLPQHPSPKLGTEEQLSPADQGLDENTDSDLPDRSIENTALAEDDWEIGSEESFCMIPGEDNVTLTTSPAVPPSKPRESSLQLKLQEENAVLKHKLSNALNRVAEVERILKSRVNYDQQLRDGIMQAQKAISSSQVFNVPVASMRSSQPSGSAPTTSTILKVEDSLPDTEPHLVARIAELEEKVRLLQVQDVTQKATIVKYKDRWDKVKDSMRKKKLAKAVAESELATRQNRIEEEVEPE